jgi:zinc D-Ala-D-Ala carboxypeptidase
MRLSAPSRPLTRRTVVVGLCVLLAAVAVVVVLAVLAERRAREAAEETRAEAAAVSSRHALLVAEATAYGEELREQADQDAAEAARADLEAAVADSTVAVDAAQAVLDASADRVADNLVRQQLADAIVAARESHGTDAATVRAATEALAPTQQTVVDAEAAWVAEEERLAAEAEAAEEAGTAEDDAVPGPPAPAPAGPAPQCVDDSTYSGPAFYTSAPGEGGDGSNGNIPASQMTRLSWGHDTVGTPQYLVTPAAQALDRLNAAYRAHFGEDLRLDLTYRSYDEQVRMREALGSVAAVPGTSSHGTGRALDVPEWSCFQFGSARRDWLVANGPAYGWVSPSWARSGGSNPEYWHYEFTG